LTRQPRELEDWIDFADKRSLALASASGEIDLATPGGRAMARLKGVFARMEAETASRRARAKHAEMAALGLPNGGGTRPFGFDADRVSHIESEAETIREAVKMLLNGMTLRATCQALNERGALTTTRRLWSTNTLKKVVCGPRVAGYRQHRGELIEAIWKPIIDREQWERLRRELDDGNSAGTSQRRHTWTGLLHCWRCDGLLGARRVNGKFSYSCRSSHHNRWDASRHGGCQGTSIRQEPTDSVLNELLLRRAEMEALGARQPDERTTALEQEIATLEDQLDALATEFADGGQPADYRRAAKKVDERLDTRRQELQIRKSRVGTIVRLDPGTIRAQWSSMEPADRRALAGAYISKVVVLPTPRRGDNRFDPNRLDLYWA
jgi:hypothetical protein